MITACFLAAACYLPIYSAMKDSIPAAKPINAAGKLKVTTDPLTHKDSVANIEEWTQDGIGFKRTTPLVSAKDLSPKLKEKPAIEVTPDSSTSLKLILLVFIQTLFVTMVYGPIAAFLVELFPVRIRYTSMSLPYHLGNGVFGGLVPLAAETLVANTKNPLAGVYYPIAIALISGICGLIWIHEKRTDTGFEEET